MNENSNSNDVSQNLPGDRSTRRRERWTRRYERRSVIWPLILIALGIVFLLKNTGTLTGNTWDVILQIWPILLIAAGLDDLIRGRGVVGPVFWIGIGVIFLLTNFNLLAINIWDVIFRLWPLIFVVIGLDILFRRQTIWLSALGVILVIAILAGSVWFIGVGIPGGLAYQGEPITQGLQGATQATVTLNPAVGLLKVKALPGGNPSGNLLEGSLQTGRGEGVQKDYTINAGTGNFSLRNANDNIPFNAVGTATQWNWDLSLNPSIPIDLRTDMGAGSMDLNLGSLELRGLQVNMGVGSTAVTLPDKGSFDVKINGAVGQITVIVPRGMGVQIHSGSGLAGTFVPDDFQKQENVYTSPGYNSSGENRIILDIAQAIGLVTVRYE
ncbi:MAG: LiaF transmembrane domain-containing protein [Omnitrophica WOR_2 bacterium]